MTYNEALQLAPNDVPAVSGSNARLQFGPDGCALHIYLDNNGDVERAQFSWHGYPFQYFRRNSENNVVVPCNSDRYYELP